MHLVVVFVNIGGTMSYDKTTQEYHLTPKGWITGAYSVYSDVQNFVEAPQDRVETWECNMEQSHPTAKEIYEWTRIWVSPNVTESVLSDLHHKFPRPKQIGE